MGAQILLCDDFEVVPPPDMNHLILFGNDQHVSYYDESTITTEEEERHLFSGDSSPGGAAEEKWPEAKSFSFYFVKQPLYDDPVIKAQIDNADQEMYQCNKLRIDISNAQKFERAEVSSWNAQMESLISNWEECRVISEAKKGEFDTFEESLQNLWCSTSDQLCFSKEELDHLIYRAHYHIEHGSNGLEDEHWVVKETKKPDGIILSEDSLAEKEASIHRFKSMAVELNEVKKELDAITWKINHLKDKIGTSQKYIKVLDVEMAQVLDDRDRSFERIKMLRLQRDKGNAPFFQSLAVMRKAKNLAASTVVKDLEVLASSEVDKFMDHWNDDKAFRDDYVKRVSSSLCERQLSRDGRIRDPPVQVVWETQVPYKSLKGGGEVHKTNREDSSSSSSSSSSQSGNVMTDKQKKERKKEAMNFNRSSAEESDVIDLEFPVYEKPKKEEEEEADEETLKKREREENIEKARLAMERKRKLQEKAAAKTAVRAQKEAEKKLKECEKKAKKKAAANSFSPSKLDQSREVNEMEKVKNLAVSGKEKHQKERSLFLKQRSFRYKHRGRGTEALPKAILNRRKAQKYWVWGLSSAALAFVLVLVVLLLR